MHTRLFAPSPCPIELAKKLSKWKTNPFHQLIQLLPGCTASMLNLVYAITCILWCQVLFPVLKFRSTKHQLLNSNYAVKWKDKGVRVYTKHKKTNIRNKKYLRKVKARPFKELKESRKQSQPLTYAYVYI